MGRTANNKRITKETNIDLALNIDGTGKYNSQMPVPFLEHMLSHIAKHASFDISIAAEGDVGVDCHHTVEDIGIVLGETFLTALGDKKGICRYGYAQIPMDEALAEVCIDLSGRAALVYNVSNLEEKIGNFDTELIEEFFKAFANHSKSAVHINLRYGRNSHHIVEAIFKAFAKALSNAVAYNPKSLNEVPSTKGSL